MAIDVKWAAYSVSGALLVQWGVVWARRALENHYIVVNKRILPDQLVRLYDHCPGLLLMMGAWGAIVLRLFFLLISSGSQPDGPGYLELPAVALILTAAFFLTGSMLAETRTPPSIPWPDDIYRSITMRKRLISRASYFFYYFGVVALYRLPV